MKVYLVAAPKMDFREFDRFIADESMPPGAAYHVEPASDAENLVELCARLCYMSYGKGRNTTKEYLANIIRQKHFSVMEHANFTFIITGVSRSLTHELVRHRHLSYSQLSQRYVDESEAKMITPPVVGSDEMRNEIAQYSFAHALGAYRELVKDLEASLPKTLSPTERRKAARQAARAVLPNATETKIAVTGNARAWREMIEKRDSPFADPEIRELAHTIFTILHRECPLLFPLQEDDPA